MAILLYQITLCLFLSLLDLLNWRTTRINLHWCILYQVQGRSYRTNSVRVFAWDAIDLFLALIILIQSLFGELNFVNVGLFTTRFNFQAFRLRNSEKRFDQLTSHTQIFHSKSTNERKIFHSVIVEGIELQERIWCLWFTVARKDVTV